MSMQAYYSISPSGWCENNPIRYLDLTGKSTHINEDGEVLAGIQVDVYYDEGLTHHYYAEEWNAWNALTDQEQIEYAYHNPIRYTDKEGYYQFAKDPRYVEKPIDIYVVATDTAGIYETQVQHGQIEYWKSPIWADGHQDSSGRATVDFVLKKKQ